MRINLAEQDKRQPRRRKRSRTFDAAWVQPRVQTAPAVKRRSRPGVMPGVEPRRRSRPGAMPGVEPRRRSRSDAARPVAEPVARPAPTVRRFPWHLILPRVPAMVILAGVIALFTYISTAEEFFVYQAQVEGVHHLDAGTIYQTAAIDEQNIFWIEPHQVAARIGQIEGVKRVHVRCRVWPAEVTITVEEREPVILWRAQSQGRDWWLDEEGVVLPYHGDPKSPETVFVIDSSERHLKTGDRIRPEGIASSVRQWAAALPDVRIFFYEPDRGLSFVQQVNGRKWPVYVGTGNDAPRQIQIVQALTEHFVTQNLYPLYVDARWAEHPVYGWPVSEASAGGQ